MTLRRLHRSGGRTRVRLGVAWLAIAAAVSSLGQTPPESSSTATDATTGSTTAPTVAPSEQLENARAAYDLGVAARKAGSLEDAKQHLHISLEIRQELADDSLEVAASLTELGRVTNLQGKLEAAEDYFRQALVIYQRLAPDSLDLAKSWNNVGTARLNQGDLATAGTYYRQALALRERLSPNSLEVASSLNNLGMAAFFSGNLEAARESLDRALVIKEKLAPDSLGVAMTLGGLANVALANDEPELAWQYESRALKIYQALHPEGFRVAYAFNVLGRIARHLGELDKAAAYSLKALKMQQQLAPDSLALADTLNDLAAVALERKEWDTAQDYYRRAYDIGRRLAPDGLSSAAILNSLGRVAKGRGELQRAADYFNRSLDTLDVRIGRLGANHNTQGSFRSLYAHYYRDAIELQLDTDRDADAFAILERSRARSFLAMTAEKELVFAGDLPADLADARRALAQRYDQIQGQIWRLDPQQDQPEIDALLSQLSTLRRQRDDLTESVRKASPRLAALKYPQPIDVSQARLALDPGTVMLSYSVGKQRSDLFILSRDGDLDVLPIAIGEAELRREVNLFREQIAAASGAGATPVGTAVGAHAFVDRTAERLYALLIAPAEAQVSAADRLLLIADGPLHYLPFAALIRPAASATESSDEPDRYLAVWKPLHNALSATVYAQMQQDRHRRPSSYAFELAAFGDPAYVKLSATPHLESKHPAAETAEDLMPRWRNAIERGLDLSPLPASRQEVESIAKLYPAGASEIFLGARATEEHAKELGQNVRFVHFATHGFVDTVHPLDSGLALTMPIKPEKDHDNGLFQAWEIFESLRLEADLVVLSACGSSLGKEQGGEGLLSLTRAFQFAGARSVAATLWNVEDRVTAELMVRFYRHLKTGEPKDVALRNAQLDLIRQPLHTVDDHGNKREIDASAPYYWAAFQLTGDWR